MIHRSAPFEVAVDALSDAVLLLCPSGRILWVNQAAAALTDRSAESLLSLTLMDIRPPRSAENAEASLRSRHLPAFIELDIFRPNLSSCRLEVSLSLLAGVDPPVLITIGRDVSQRRLLDEQLRRADFQTLQF